MSTKRILHLVVVTALLALLAYAQFRTWRDFGWRTFSMTAKQLRVSNIAAAVALIYITYFLRALRWKLFLKPVGEVRVGSLVPPQFIGFTGLALLGRPGELVRPYLIAKKQGMTVASQLAVWTVERISDLGAFSILLCFTIFTSGSSLPFPRELHRAALVFGAAVVLMAAVVFIIRCKGSSMANLAAAKVSQRPQHPMSRLAGKLGEFAEGLNTVKDAISFIQICAVSLLMWVVIALVYRLVLNAYSEPALQTIGMAKIFLLLASSMVGSLVQLPGIGGGSQLATIAMLASAQWFAVPKEVAVSCSILLWLVNFVAVVPVGLALARREHLAIAQVAKALESQELSTHA